MSPIQKRFNERMEKRKVFGKKSPVVIIPKSNDGGWFDVHVARIMKGRKE